MKKKIAMVSIMIFQFGSYALIFEYFAFRTGWIIVLMFFSIIPLLKFRCKTCSTPVSDEKVLSKIRHLTLNNYKIFDECPVCGQEML